MGFVQKANPAYIFLCNINTHVKKILSTEQIHEIERYTIEYEPISSPDLMERSGKLLAAQVQEIVSEEEPVHIFCGVGNNGGDGLVTAHYLSDYSKNIVVYIVHFSQHTSPEFDWNLKRLEDHNHIPIKKIEAIEDFPAISENEVIIDAILGIGLNRPTTELMGELISKINRTNALIISLDIPSGLFSEDNSSNTSSIIQASETLTVGVMKLALMYDSNYQYVGNWRFVDIQLKDQFLDRIKTNDYVIEHTSIQAILRSGKKTDHKGKCGHALLVVGSYGKIGAAILAAFACLRTGTGLLTTHLPKCGYEIMQHAVPESMVLCDSAGQIISDSDLNYHDYSSIGIGPGIGTDILTEKALDSILGRLKRNRQPVVLDADALNIIAGSRKNLWDDIPKNSILTPHPKEFARLIGEELVGYPRHQKQRELAVKYQICIILKAAHTCIALPDGRCFFNTSGNPGMATAGSGDVLTGMLTALLAQGYNSIETCLLGVYLHGLSGNMASKNQAEESMIARDIIENIGKAMMALRKKT